MNRSAPIVSMMAATAVMLSIVASTANRTHRSLPKPQALIEAEKRLCKAQDDLNKAIDEYEQRHGEGSSPYKRNSLSGCYNLGVPVGESF